MPIQPTAVPAAPVVPDRSDRVNFPAQMYAFHLWEHDSEQPGMAALAAVTYNNALEAAAQATAKSLASFKGVYAAGTTYALGDTVYSSPSFYISNVNANTGNTPASSPTQWSLVSSPARTGGASTSGSVTLLAGSGANQKITTTAFGQSVTLPDATLCFLSSYYFRIQNFGPYDLKILDAAGVVRGFVPPLGNVTLGLEDNSTAAGAWLINDANLLGVTAEFDLTTAAAGTGSGNLVIVPLDATRTMVIGGDTTVYAVVYDASTQTFGTAVSVGTVVTGASKMGACLLAANTVLFSAIASATVLNSRVLSVVGSVITANTNAAITVASGAIIGTPVTFNSGASAVLPVVNGSSGLIYPLGISGTTVTTGTAITGTAVSSNNVVSIPHVYTISATAGVAFMTNAGGTGPIAQPFTIATSVFTAGTSANLPGTTVFYDMRSIALGSGRWAVLGQTAANAVSIVSVAANVATVSNAASVLGAGVTVAPSAADMVAISSTKVLVASAGAVFNIVQDNAGTASAGTAVTGQVVAGQSAPAIIQGSLASSVIHATASTSTGVRSYSINCSGASPVVTERFINGAQDIALPARSSQYGCPRDPLTVQCGTVAMPIPAWSSGAYNKRNQSLAGGALRAFPYTQDLTAAGTIAAIGYTAASESWVKADQGSTFANGGLFIQRIEAAQP